jgi:hypothetical protein
VSTLSCVLKRNGEHEIRGAQLCAHLANSMQYGFTRVRHAVPVHPSLSI